MYCIYSILHCTACISQKKSAIFGHILMFTDDHCYSCDVDTETAPKDDEVLQCFLLHTNFADGLLLIITMALEATLNK